MPDLYHYRDAQKLAQREFRAAVFKGEYPYPSVLDDIVPDDRINRGQDVGYAHIPMEFVVGTRTSGRTNAFARNFLPLMKENTEFALKWDKLCRSQMEEGIRDPILAYEYMNRYYVQEGNKRVSVLKFCGADSVYAHVIRVLPEQNDSLETVLYNELIEFSRYSRVNYLEFTKPGGYARLQQFMGKKPGEEWTEEERRDFSSIHYHFRKAYEALGGKKLSSTRGDALLAFIEVYSYADLRSSTEDQIKAMLEKAWEEITLQQEQIPLDLKFEPEEVKPSLLSQVLSIGEKKEKKVAFIYDSDPAVSGWAQAHEEGRKYVDELFGDTIETCVYDNAMRKGRAEVIEQAIADGNTILFTTSAPLMPAALRSAVEHPEITILNCSPASVHRYVRTYYARMYEADFVMGAIAGAFAGNENIGYLGYYCNEMEDAQIFAVDVAARICGINAFALGVQLTNPQARVCLEWFGREGGREALRRLADQKIRLIYSPEATAIVSGEDSSDSFGLTLVTEGGFVNLASSKWQWGTYYETLLRSILDKSFQAEYEESRRALNYYWGMSSGVISVSCSDTVPPGIHKLSKLLQENIKAGLSHPFEGEIYAQGGKPVNGGDDIWSLIAMDWLAENVIGEIPKEE